MVTVSRAARNFRVHNRKRAKVLLTHWPDTQSLFLQSQPLKFKGGLATEVVLISKANQTSGIFRHQRLASRFLYSTAFPAPSTRVVHRTQESSGSLVSPIRGHAAPLRLPFKRW